MDFTKGNSPFTSIRTFLKHVFKKVFEEDFMVDIRFSNLDLECERILVLFTHRAIFFGNNKLWQPWSKQFNIQCFISWWIAQISCFIFFKPCSFRNVLNNKGLVYCLSRDIYSFDYLKDTYTSFNQDRHQECPTQLVHRGHLSGTKPWFPWVPGSIPGCVLGSWPPFPLFYC